MIYHEFLFVILKQMQQRERAHAVAHLHIGSSVSWVRFVQRSSLKKLAWNRNEGWQNAAVRGTTNSISEQQRFNHSALTRQLKNTQRAWLNLIKSIHFQTIQ